MNNLVEIATFAYVNDSDILQSLFQAEGIDYFMKNESTASVMNGYINEACTGLVVRSADIEAAVRLIKDAGFQQYLDPKFA